MTSKRKKILTVCCLYSNSCASSSSWSSRATWASRAAWAAWAFKHSLSAKLSNPGWEK